jgi:hypothetical protein
LNKCTFGLGYEFGLEDSDFGMQLAIKGLMCCLPEPKIIHLKAPVEVLELNLN